MLILFASRQNLHLGPHRARCSRSEELAIRQVLASSGRTLAHRQEGVPVPHKSEFALLLAKNETEPPPAKLNAGRRLGAFCSVPLCHCFPEHSLEPHFW